jgi:hypothetical protein
MAQKSFSLMEDLKTKKYVFKNIEMIKIAGWSYAPLDFAGQRVSIRSLKFGCLMKVSQSVCFQFLIYLYKDTKTLLTIFL